MHPYQQYDVQDFAADPLFRKWVLEPDAETSLFWEEWLSDHPTRGEIAERARHLVLAVQADAQAASGETLANMWSVIAEQTLVRARQPSKALVFRHWLSGNAYRVAASWILLLLSVGIGYYMMVHRSPQTTYATHYSEIRNIRLPDGSEVALNANSTLEFDADWDGRTVREVNLRGEAFFSVREKEVFEEGKRIRAKFIVHTEDVAIEVLGTQFNVTNRRNQTAVVLRSGKVKLDLNGGKVVRTVMMKPGDYVNYSHQQKTLIQKTVSPDNYDTWKEKRWVFRNTPLKEVALKLEETFGLSARWENEELKQRTVSGVVPTDNLDTVLDALSVTLKLRITKQQGSIFIQE